MNFGTLKAAVIVMGILIVAGMAFLVYGLSVGLHKDTSVETQTGQDAPTAPAAPATAAFGDIDIDLPAGSQITDYKIQGDRLVISVSVLGGGASLIVVDLSSGTRLGTITLK
ncbi:MAG: hypothetical protein RIM72_00910 [Alphaproteobacteria bacterium]